MRKPLKYQIMLPMLGVMLTTLVLVSVVDAWLAGRRARHQIENQLHDIAATLEQSTFPLTEHVLEQMRGLSGAEFIVQHSDGTIVASSETMRLNTGQLSQTRATSSQVITLNKRVLAGDASYFHVPVALRPTESRATNSLLHCFYPESAYQNAWREAVMPPLVLGSFSLVMVITIGSLVARRVTRPIQILLGQIDRIARGQFHPVNVPSRNDELQDLSVSVNRMADMLTQYEGHVRRNERLQTLDQLGGGIAHQLRNSVTGCRMAVDLHRRHCPEVGDGSFDVAIAQLELMEKYLRRFLALGKRNKVPFTVIDVTEVVNDVLPLIRPRSSHLGVELAWHPPETRLFTRGDADALSEAVINLLLNAVEAASEWRSKNGRHAPWVSITIKRVTETAMRLEVCDSGDGPEPELQKQLFEPLVSGKPDGVGLGLAIAREIAHRHDGSIGWQRDNNATCFYIELPEISAETVNVKTACC